MYRYRRSSSGPIGAPSGRTVAGPSSLSRRDISGRQVTTIIILGILTMIILVAIASCIFRALRRRHNDPKYIPTPFLKRLWKNWHVAPYGSSYRPASLGDSTDAASSHRISRPRIGSAVFEGSVEHPSEPRPADTVDRSTSIRSIMTLPAYRQNPSNTEQVLGREGDRDGVDVVVELPTAEEMESMRDDEMEALYQIRLARRQENAEREERRRRRREARDRGDFVALEELRAATRAAGDNSAVDGLRQDYDRLKEQRQRAVSSVSYGDLGVARHDGSRIRANSTESERVGLLSDAASIAALSTQSGAHSHRRNRSSSVLSIDSDLASPELTRSRASSRADTARLSTGHTGAGSSPEVIEADLGDEMPPHSPPGYEDVSLEDARSRATTPQNEPPPDYPGPAQRRSGRGPSAADDQERGDQERGRQSSRRGVDGAPQLPSLRIQRLPQIVIETSSERPTERPTERR